MDQKRAPSKIVSWEEIERWSEIIAEKIGKTEFDSIVSVIRGGLVPSRIIADYLNIKDIFTLKTEHWGITATPDGRAKITNPIVIDLKGRSVLVVDDITDTGQSLKLAVDATKQKEPKMVKSATFLHISRSEIVPDYYAEKITEENWKWFIWPWNRREDMRNLVMGCLDGGTVDQLIDCLSKKHDLFVSRRELDETLTWLEIHNKIKMENSRIRKI
jgi:hypoxanthine phosphoribosyltransferase